MPNNNIEKNKKKIIIQMCKELIVDNFSRGTDLNEFIRKFIMINIYKLKIPLNNEYVESIFDEETFNQTIAFLIMQAVQLYTVDIETVHPDKLIQDIAKKLLEEISKKILSAKKFLKLWIDKINLELNQNLISNKTKLQNLIVKFIRNNNFTNELLINTQNIKNSKKQKKNINKCSITKITKYQT